MKQQFTELNDRVLRFDGVSVVSPEMVARCLLLGAAPVQLRVTSTSWEIEQFNLNVPDEQQLKENTDEVSPPDLSWRLPDEYLNMDLREHLLDVAGKFIADNYRPEEHQVAIGRVADELEEIDLRGMVEFIKTIIYVIDTFKKNGVVWGVGRGSSCASFILFILGLHSVDCIKLDVPLTEFFHD